MYRVFKQRRYCHAPLNAWAYKRFTSSRLAQRDRAVHLPASLLSSPDELTQGQHVCGVAEHRQSRRLHMPATLTYCCSVCTAKLQVRAQVD
jgi:hypothetical protein